MKQMYIDLHTHIFPNKIAKKAIPKLAGVIKQEPSTDGTYTGLKKSMKEAAIDISVVLPTVTNLNQFDSIIRFADQINEKFYENPSQGILSLAGIHPMADNYAEQLQIIKDHGFAGLKIHPDYQGIFFNDIRCKRIIDKAAQLGLFVITHTGYDPYSPDLVHCSVPMILEVLRDVQPDNLVLAHMGSNLFYTDVENYLLGSDVYLDTAYVISHIPSERLSAMIHKHGADKVLFGSDTPWTTQSEVIRCLNQLDLTEEEFALVSHKNAMKLLHFNNV